MGPGTVASILFLTIGGTLFFFLKARHTERMAMIEKGMLYADNRRFRWMPNFIGVKLGMLIFGAGMGMLVAYFIDMAMNDQTIYPAMIMLFGGGSLVASFFVERKLAQGHEQNNFYERKPAPEYEREYQEEI